MEYPVTGLHHITACADSAQQDINFFTQVVGQRLIKQTILFDGRYAHYHLYYANEMAEPGTVMTTFPYNRVKGRTGSGQIQATVYTVAKGTLPFWVDHLDRHRVAHRGIHERFGQKFVWRLR
jgi:glyoxalase family protein